MNFRLIDHGWHEAFGDAMGSGQSQVRIICPFIKYGTVERLLHWGRPGSIQVITRFSLQEFYEGVSDISALSLLLENGAQIRGVRNLHAKLYLFGGKRIILTSANLTDAALFRNQEFGFVAEDALIVGECRQYFERLWERAGCNLHRHQLEEWTHQVTKALASGARYSVGCSLPDHGVDAGFAPPLLALPAWVGHAAQAFVKFFGSSDTRADRSLSIRDAVERSGCHWACTYPKDKRPRAVRDGAVMFMGRLVRAPDDILIFGRAVAMQHVEGRDDASASEIETRPWKARWPHYVRVHHPEFIGGTLENAVSLNALMDTLKSDAFASTQRNTTAAQGNLDPRKAFLRQPAVKLSSQGKAWVEHHLQRSYDRFGQLPAADLDSLDWPV